MDRHNRAVIPAIVVAALMLPTGHATAVADLHAVSTTACSGVVVRPGMSLRSVIAGRPEGTTFCLRRGVYHLTNRVVVKSHDRIIGEPGAILDGQGIAPGGLWGYGDAQRDVTVRGLVLRRFAGPALHAGWGWTVKGNVLKTSEVGVEVNFDIVLVGNRIHHNRRFGLFGGPTRNVLIARNVISYNNTSHSCHGGCVGHAGATKIVGSSRGSYGIIWRENEVHHNIGNGIWSDGNVHGVLYERNTVYANTGSGILHEISWKATMRRNVLRGNATSVAGKSCHWGSQIHVNNSKNVRIVWNRVRGAKGANGICVVDARRNESAPFPTGLSDIAVRNNVVRLGRNQSTGLVGGGAVRVSFDANTYVVPRLGGAHWAWWDRYPLTWREFRGRHQESNGRVRVA